MELCCEAFACWYVFGIFPSTHLYCVHALVAAWCKHAVCVVIGGTDLEGEEQGGGAELHAGNDWLQDGGGVGAGGEGTQKANRSDPYAGQFGQSTVDEEW